MIRLRASTRSWSSQTRRRKSSGLPAQRGRRRVCRAFRAECSSWWRRVLADANRKSCPIPRTRVDPSSVTTCRPRRRDVVASGGTHGEGGQCSCQNPVCPLSHQAAPGRRSGQDVAPANAPDSCQNPVCPLSHQAAPGPVRTIAGPGLVMPREWAASRAVRGLTPSARPAGAREHSSR
jgi:hypothetical protein